VDKQAYIDHIYSKLTEKASKEELFELGRKLLVFSGHALATHRDRLGRIVPIPDKVMLYTLHRDGDYATSIASCIATNPEEAAKIWGGEFIAREGGACGLSTNREELGVVGTLKLGAHLFREMDSTDEALAGCMSGNVVYCKAGLNLLGYRGHTLQFAMKQRFVASIKDA